MENTVKNIENTILKNPKRQKVHQFLSAKKFTTPFFCITIKDVITAGPIQTHVRNEKCTKISCLFDLNEIAKWIDQEILKNGKFYMVKCPECNAYLDQGGFYIDQDMEDAINVLKQLEDGNTYLEAVLSNNELYEVGVSQKNEWILKDKNQNTQIVLKQSDMLTEYEQQYPFFPSKQTHQFYENGWVFANENVDILKNNKLQSVLYLFFPSLETNRWKEVIIYHSIKEKRQSYFQKYMSVARMYSKEKGEHSIIASGGFGFPEKSKYERRTFEVPLFRDDPDTQVPKEVDLVDLAPMNTPRVFHQLMSYNGKMYAIGGYMRENEVDIPLKSCERYNPQIKKWEQISDLHHSRQLFSILNYKGMLYVIGGKVQNQNKQEEEDLTIEYYDSTKEKWTIVTVFQHQNPERYFTERAYCFVKADDTVVIFGGRKEKVFNDQKPCDRSRSAAELDLNTGAHRLTGDMLPGTGIAFDDVTDFQGIYFNNRHIFAFKKNGKEERKDFVQPSVCKYYEQSSNNKFTIEAFKKIIF